MAKRYEASHRDVVAFLSWLNDSPHLHHLSWYTRFRAVVELWFAAVRRDDPTYLERVKELSPEAVRGTKEPGPGNEHSACGHFAKLWAAMLVHPQDLLGEAYQAYSVRDTKNLAQYFTPDHLAEAMAQMTCGDIPEDTFRKEGGCRLLEPACGSGVMMIHAVAAIHKQWGDWGVSRTHVVMVDMDPVCVAMAAVQMTWLPWRVGSLTMLQGDSLAQTQKPIWGWGSVNMPAEYTKVIVKPEPEVRVVVKEDKHA